MNKTLYDILEVNRSASDKEVEAACERLIKRAEEEMPAGTIEYQNRIKVLEHARDSLNSIEKRQKYDRVLRNRVIRNNAPKENLFLSAMIDVLRSKKMIFIFILLLIIILTIPDKKSDEHAEGSIESGNVQK